MEDYEVRIVDDVDVSEIVELLDHVFKGWPKFDLKCSKEEHWIWKHRDNPVSRSVVVASIRDGRLIVVGHSLPFNVRIMGSDTLCDVGSDVAIHPEYREMGLRTAAGFNNFQFLLI